MTKLQDKKRKAALGAITAWRILYYDDLIGEKDSESIKQKINKKYGKYLSPLRDL